MIELTDTHTCHQNTYPNTGSQQEAFFSKCFTLSQFYFLGCAEIFKIEDLFLFVVERGTVVVRRMIYSKKLGHFTPLSERGRSEFVMCHVFL